MDPRGWSQVISRMSKATLAIKSVAALREDPLVVLTENRVIFDDYKLLMTEKENLRKDYISAPSSTTDDIIAPGSDLPKDCHLHKSRPLVREMPGVVCMTIYRLFKKKTFAQHGSASHV